MRTACDRHAFVVGLGRPVSHCKVDGDPDDPATRKRNDQTLERRTYQWTRTPPPASSPLWIKSTQEGKCSNRFSSSTSSTSTTLWVMPLNRASSSGSLSTDKTWVISQACNASLRRSVKSLLRHQSLELRMTGRSAKGLSARTRQYTISALLGFCQVMPCWFAAVIEETVRSRDGRAHFRSVILRCRCRGSARAFESHAYSSSALPHLLPSLPFGKLQIWRVEVHVPQVTRKLSHRIRHAVRRCSSHAFGTQPRVEHSAGDGSIMIPSPSCSIGWPLQGAVCTSPRELCYTEVCRLAAGLLAQRAPGSGMNRKVVKGQRSLPLLAACETD